MAGMRDDLCVVIGNGPSLKGFDFTRLAGIPTLGMNAAYRHWDKIGWYPTYYACLDDQLIQTHHAEIYRLWKDGRIGSFFLEGGFFDLHPDCINAPGFHSLDQMVGVLYRKRGAAQGWPSLAQEAPFRTRDHNKITTGAWATRFAAWQGHRCLAIMGVDLKYVEILPEAQKGEGVTLVMASTPASNPNYFFDGYQQAGDRYNIPNPDVHNNALHIDSFRLVAADFAAEGVDCRIVNTNPASLVEEQKVFPLCPIEALLDPEGLAAVVVPAHAGEVAAILDNFRLWADEDHAPGLLPGGRPRLVFAFNNDRARPRAAEITAAFARWRMERFFRPPEFWYFDLTGAADRYERDFTRPVDEQGYKAGPNNLFFLTMKRAADLGRHVFQMETDCVPLRGGWLAALDAEVRATAPFWVLGSRYHGVHKLSPVFREHLNGNAVYAVGDPAFGRFLDGFWEPQTRRIVAQVDARLAYDCVLSKLWLEDRDSDPAIQAAWLLSRAMLREGRSILNNAGAEDIANLPADHVALLQGRFPQAHILHNRTARDWLSAALPRLPDAPRLLVIDMTAMGNGTATGEVKSTLLGPWPAARLLQLAAPLPGKLSLVSRVAPGRHVESPVAADHVGAIVTAFDPQVILYRPLPDRPALHRIAQEIIARHPQAALVTWIMDDWPARLEGDDPVAYPAWDRDLRALLGRAALNLSISDAMSTAFAARYGVAFQAFANAVDLDVWRPAPPPPADGPADGPLVLRYAGGLAPDMNADSLVRIALAVASRRAAGQDVRFEINTRPHWQKLAGGLFAGMDGTSIDTVDRSQADYVAWLSGADALVIAYNFDATSLRYVRYSMANKMPECLATGRPILLHGPRGVATVDYLAAEGVAALVDKADLGALARAIAGLADPAGRAALGQKGRALAEQRHALRLVADRLVETIAGVAGSPPAPAPAPQDSDAAPVILVPDAQATGWEIWAGPGAPPAGLILTRDPAALAAAALAAGQAPDPILAAWSRQTAAALALWRGNRRGLAVLPQAAMTRTDADGHLAPDLVRVLTARGLPVRAWPVLADAPADPVLALVGRALAAAAPDADNLRQALQAATLVTGANDPDLSGTVDIGTIGTLLAAREATATAPLRTAWQVTQADLHRTRAEQAALQARLTAAEQLAQAQGRTLADLQASATETAAILAQTTARQDGQQAELARLYRSKSWRYTGPLRALRHWLTPPPPDNR